MALRTLLSARWVRSTACEMWVFPIRAHSGSAVVEQDVLLKKATQLLGVDLGGLIERVDPKHPLIGMARKFTAHNLDSSCKNVVMSVSKAINSLQNDGTTISSAQESLAELAGMIHRAYLIHLTVTDSIVDSSNDVGNKIAILAGDYFLAKACLGLAHLHNTHVVEIMSSAICDMVEGTFSKLSLSKEQTVTDTHIAHTNTISSSTTSHEISPKNNSRFYHGDTEFSLPEDLDLMGDVEAVDIVENCKLMKAQFSVLLAKSCRCSAILGGYSETVQDLASDFAKHLSLAEHFSCLSVSEDTLPALQTGAVSVSGGSSANMKQMENDDWRDIMIKAARNLCLHHSNQCLKLLHKFPINKATQELKNIIPHLGNNCT